MFSEIVSYIISTVIMKHNKRKQLLLDSFEDRFEKQPTCTLTVW